MVNYIISIFGSELKSITQSAFVLALAAIFADVLSLFRDRLLAAEFGASRSLDLYYTAFRVPDLIYTFSLFFAASTALIPILLEKTQKEGEAEEFFGNIFSLFSLVTVLLVSLAFFLMPFLIKYFAPGFSITDQGIVIKLSRILLLSPLLLGLSNLVSSVIQSYRRFYVYAASPLFYNLGIIFGILFLMPRYGLFGLVWGVILGAFLHFAIQIPTVFSLGFQIKLRFPMITADAVKSLKLSLPRTLGLSLNQVVVSFITAMASTLGAGAVSVFNFATNLQSVPLSIIGLSYSISAFPTMAAAYVQNGKKEFLDHFSLAARHILFWSLPATAFFIVLRAQIVRVVLGSGSFSWHDTRLTAAALFLLSLSILSQGLIMLFVRAFYATGKTFIPVVVNFISSVVSVVCAWQLLELFRTSENFQNWFMTALRVSDVSSGGVLILPLAISIGSTINLLMLMFYFAKEFHPGEMLRFAISKSIMDSVLASISLGAVSYFFLNFLEPYLNLDTFVGIFLQGFIAGIAGIISGIIVLTLLKNQEFKDFYEAFRDGFWRKIFVVTSEPEKLP